MVLLGNLLLYYNFAAPKFDPNNKFFHLIECPLFARRSGDELPTVYKLKGNGAAGSSTAETEPICLFDAKLFDELLREARSKGYNALYTLQVE